MSAIAGDASVDALSATLAMVDGNRALAAEILDEHLKRTPVLIAQLDAARNTDDFETMAMVALAPQRLLVDPWLSERRRSSQDPRGSCTQERPRGLRAGNASALDSARARRVRDLRRARSMAKGRRCLTRSPSTLLRAPC